MDINYLVARTAQITKEHGWREDARSFGDFIALGHTEFSEALEEYRNGHGVNETYYRSDGKPEGIPSELADVMIRVADMCDYYGIDLETALEEKLNYNNTRPFRHGGKKL